MDITQVLPVHVKVQDPNERAFEQSIEYEWKPSYCTKCLIIGHSCQNLETKRQDEHGVNKQKTKPVKMVWGKSRTQGKMSSMIATQQDTVSNEEKPRPKSEMASTKSAQHKKMFNKQENVITTLPTEQQVHDKEQQATISHQTKQMTSPKQNQDDTWKEARNNSFGKLVQTTLKNRAKVARRLQQYQKILYEVGNVERKRVKEISSSRIVKKIAYGWKWCNNYQHSNGGRIWLLWDPAKCDFTHTHSSSQYIHRIVKVYRDSMDFQFTAIYGLHNIRDRGVLWADLKAIADQMLDPWLIMGDFNTILHIEDRSNGAPVQEAEIRDFNNFLVETGMMEIVRNI
ncbi:hypothetical protein KY289_030138 [Solanum tuberosum]|nr:hypothetical protein KY289_030138 [Solanum tuberosum]